MRTFVVKGSRPLRLLSLLVLLTVALPTIAQPKLPFDTLRWSVRATTGYNMYGPLELHLRDQIGRLEIGYRAFFIREDSIDPALGLQINGNITGDRRLNDPDAARYILMTPGRIGSTATLFLRGHPEPRVSLSATASVGVQYYPLVSSDSINNKNWLNGYEQLLISAGVGVEFSRRFRLVIEARRHRHDLSTRTERYYKASVSERTSFTSLHVGASLLFAPQKAYQPFLAFDWYGRPSGDPQTKLYSITVGGQIGWDNSHSKKTSKAKN